MVYPCEVDHGVPVRRDVVRPRDKPFVLCDILWPSS